LNVVSTTAVRSNADSVLTTLLFSFECCRWQPLRDSTGLAVVVLAIFFWMLFRIRCRRRAWVHEHRLRLAIFFWMLCCGSDSAILYNIASSTCYFLLNVVLASSPTWGGVMVLELAIFFWML